MKKRRGYRRRHTNKGLKNVPLRKEIVVLLPTSTHKLIAQWQGPYKVLRRVGKVTYEVYMSNRRKQRNIYHINLLHKWYDREAGETIGLAEEDD